MGCGLLRIRVSVFVCLAAFHFIVCVLLTLAYSRFHPSGVSSPSFPSSSHPYSTQTPSQDRAILPSM